MFFIVFDRLLALGRQISWRVSLQISDHDSTPSSSALGILNTPWRLSSSLRCSPAILFTNSLPSGVRNSFTSRLSTVPRCRYSNPSFSQREASDTTPLCSVCRRWASSLMVAHSRSLYPLTWSSNRYCKLVTPCWRVISSLNRSKQRR